MPSEWMGPKLENIYLRWSYETLLVSFWTITVVNLTLSSEEEEEELELEDDTARGIQIGYYKYASNAINSF